MGKLWIISGDDDFPIKAKARELAAGFCGGDPDLREQDVFNISIRNIRGHSAGGYMYTAGAKTLQPGQSAEFKGAAKGISKYGMGTAMFAPGTAKAQIIILVNWKWDCKQKPVSQVKDVELEIK